MNAIEQLEAENDRLGQLLRDRNQRIREMEAENRRLRIGAKGLAAGAPATIDKIIDEYEAEINELTGVLNAALERLEQYERTLPHAFLLPPEPSPDIDTSVSDWRNEKWAHTDVTIIALFRDDFSYGIDRFFMPPTPFLGDMNSAKDSVMNHLAIGVTGIVLPDDWAGTIDGLSNDDINRILLELNFYHRRTDEEYNEHRLQLFNEYFPKIRADMEEKGYHQERSTIQTRFNMFIKRTFQNFDKRQNQVKVSLPESKQNLLTDNTDEA